MKKKEQYLLDVQRSTDKKLATTQHRQTLQSSDESNVVSIGCYVWVLPTTLPANRDCLLKPYISVGEPVYYHMLHGLCISGGRTQNQFILS